MFRFIIVKSMSVELAPAHHPKYVRVVITFYNEFATFIHAILRICCSTLFFRDSFINC